MEQEVQNVVETTENTETQTVEEKEVKTFTQEDVDKIISERLAKEKKKQPSAEEMKAFNEWKESQKTEAEKQEEIKKELEQAKKDLAIANNKMKVANAKVKEKFQEIVLEGVLKMEGDFEENLQSFIQNYPEFIEDDAPKTITNGVSVQNIQEKETGVSSILKSIQPEAFK